MPNLPCFNHPPKNTAEQSGDESQISYMVEEHSLREALMALDLERTSIEREVATIVAQLNSPGANGTPSAGIRSPLIDDGGFPRADIDVYHVRERRHRLACLRNDHKAVMNKVEASLYALHREATRSVSSYGRKSAEAPAQRAVAPRDLAPIIAFCQVENVLLGSPAEQGGLRSGDRILSFGDATVKNHRNLMALSQVVRDSIGKSGIKVLLLRAVGGISNQLEMTITPREWEGSGLLGCRFLPCN